MEPRHGDACVPCWNGDTCKWLSVGSCRFSHQRNSGVDGLALILDKLEGISAPLNKVEVMQFSPRDLERTK